MLSAILPYIMPKSEFFFLAHTKSYNTANVLFFSSFSKAISDCPEGKPKAHQRREGSVGGTRLQSILCSKLPGSQALRAACYR